MSMREQGFTLVELLVASILLVIVVGMVVTGVVRALGSANHSAAGSVSEAAVTRVATQLRSDIASAETTDRIKGRVRDAYEFASGVRTGAGIKSTDPGNLGDPVDIMDVIEATPSRLTLQADVLADAAGVVNAECVTWEVRDDGTNVTYTRTVRQNCGSAPVEQTVMLKAPSALSSMNPAPFSYRLECGAADCAGDAKAPSCTTWGRNTVTNHTRSWIVGVSANIVGGGQQGREASDASTRLEMSIRSRSVTDYQAALGC